MSEQDVKKRGISFTQLIPQLDIADNFLFDSQKLKSVLLNL